MRALLLALALAATALQRSPAAEPSEAELINLISSLDSGVFDAFNRCADPAQLRKHATYFDQHVEFYHDTGGVTWDRKHMLANTRKYACGHYTRVLSYGHRATGAG